MVRTDIGLKEIETISDVLAVLRDPQTDLENNPELQEACKNILGEDWELLKNDQEAIIERLQEIEPEIKVEDAQITVEDIKMESKAYTSKELEGFEDALREHIKKQGEKTDYRKFVEDFVNRQEGLNKSIKKLTEIAKVVEIEQEIALITENKLGEERNKEVAKAVLEKDIETINELKIGEEAEEEIRLLVKEVTAEERLERETMELIEKTVKGYREIIGEVTEDEERTIEKVVEEELREEISRPWSQTKEIDNPVKVLEDEKTGKITVTVQGEETTPIYENTTVAKGVVSVGRPVTAEKAKELSVLEKEVKNKIGELRKSSSGEELRAIRKSLLENGATFKQVGVVRQLVVTGSEYAEISHRMKENGFTERQINDAVKEGKMVTIAVQRRIKDVANLPKTLMDVNNLCKGKVKVIRDLSETATRLEGQFKSIGAVSRIADLQARINGLNPMRLVGKMIPGAEKLVAKFGMQSTAEMSAAVASQIAAHGIKEGTMLALKSLLATGKVAMATATEVGTAAGSTVAVGAATAVAVPLIGLIIFAATIAIEAIKWAGGKIFGFVKDKINGLLESMNLDLGGLGLKDKFGGLVGGGMELAVYGVGALFAFFAFVQARLILTGAAVGVIIFALSMVAGSSSLTINQILPWVTNRYVGGGYCVYIGPKEAGSGGDINCDQTVEDQGAIGVDKENFIRVAGMWRAGGDVNARLCFNDVVKRAKKAQRSPEYALWAWLHESGASNYTGFPEVEDFGIHGLSDDEGVIPPNEFNRQINKFLVLDPASKCPDLAAEDYWVAFSTNYLTGTCDPEVVVNGFTGRTYADELRKTWSWIASIPMPENIGPGGGTIESVEGEGGTNLVVVEEEDGLYLCEVMAESTGETVGDVPLPTLDPDITIPVGCPDGLPIDGNAQSIISNITQGPACAKYSHKSMANAVDFGVMGTIVATHDGIARAGSNSVYGYYVDVTGKCGGVVFSTRYAHMPSPPSWTIKEVKKGNPIGTVNNTGSSTGNHLHYDIRGGSLPLSISAYLGLSKDLKGCCNRISCAQ